MVKKVGRYELGQLLGEGSFSKVKMGKDSQDPKGKKYAIKIIEKTELAEQNLVEQMKREIAVMKLLKHPNIIGLKEVLQTEGHIYLVLELITGGELFDKIVEQKRFDEDTARKYFQQLMMGVQYCHSQGIVHRDLKPENLLLDSSGVLKISDFGLANLQRGGVGLGSTLLDTICGTPNYVAPEVLHEKGYNGMAADIWSCGVILFVMLAGYLPFDDQELNKLFRKIERGEYRMAKCIGPGPARLIRQILVTSPADRLDTLGIMENDWFKEGFHHAENETSIIELSSTQVNKAISNVDVTNEERKSLPDGTKSPPPPMDGALDAFDLVTKLLSTSLSPLSTNTGNGTYKKIIELSPGQSIRALMQVLQELGGNPKRKDGTLHIKGFSHNSRGKGLLIYTVTVVPLVDTSISLIEFKMGRGDILDFQTLCRKVITTITGE
eukprot:TRINITY_DN448_c0_g2_i1.p1 TRINITY_DN448_c0_g2~~TRINITY_DN448_c0_g2_i1.p1  ORF type:complete len:467 (+),score=70.78 TRINITY_DN448_c0_g2_i1:90-1403(+)